MLDHVERTDLETASTAGSRVLLGWRHPAAHPRRVPSWSAHNSKQGGRQWIFKLPGGEACRIGGNVNGGVPRNFLPGKGSLSHLRTLALLQLI